MNAASIIINHPERQGHARRTAYSVLTAVAWTVYLYLWLPLVTLLAWSLGVRTAYTQLFLRDNAVDPFLFLALPLIALVCGAILLGWAEYNRVRFQGEDKRLGPELVGFDEVAAGLGVSSDFSQRLRMGRVQTVAFDDQARPARINQSR